MSTEWRQRPIDEWPGEQTKHRQRSNFRTGWARVQELLDRELKMLNAKAVVMLVALEPKDFRIDGQPRANARPAHPGVILSFDSKFGPLRYACDRFDDFADNVYAISLGLEALRKVERYGITKRGEQYKGWTALPSGIAMGSSTMTRTDAAELLVRTAGEPWHGGDVDGSVDALLHDTGLLLGEVFRYAAKIAHPDQGGDVEAFKAIGLARDILEAS